MQALQEDIGLLSVWAYTWIMEKNKTEFYHHAPAAYSIKVQLLPMLDKRVVWMHASIKPSLQCANAANKTIVVKKNLKSVHVGGTLKITLNSKAEGTPA